MVRMAYRCEKHCTEWYRWLASVKDTVWNGTNAYMKSTVWNCTDADRCEKNSVRYGTDAYGCEKHCTEWYGCLRV